VRYSFIVNDAFLDSYPKILSRDVVLLEQEQSLTMSFISFE